jgi:predicted phage replisome organizer
VKDVPSPAPIRVRRQKEKRTEGSEDMADVKWIKITTDIFDDEKILLIESLPSADSIIVIWFKLLTLAGKQNNDGVFMMSNRIAYTDEMLASIFRREINTVRFALRTFEQYGMIELIDNVITIPNWGKHQTLDAYEKKKKRDRERIARKRAEQRLRIEAPAAMSPDVSPDMSPDKSPDVAFSDRDRDIDKEGEEEREIADADAPASPPPSPTKKKPVKHKHGEYNNVLLTDEELDKLKETFPDWKERIDRLSGYIASTGKAYKSHYATIRNWAKKDQEKGGQARGSNQNMRPGVGERIGTYL